MIKLTLFLILSFLCSNMMAQDLEQINCGDLLVEYATTPAFIASKIHFEKCEKVNSQLELVTATYRVNAKNSMEVENYFSDKYDLPPMKWVEEGCHNGICVLSNESYWGGVNFEPEKISKLDKDLSLSFKMHGYYDFLKVPNHIIFDRKYIKDFIIEISICQSP